jgi:hypothetical protein
MKLETYTTLKTLFFVGDGFIMQRYFYCIEKAQKSQNCGFTSSFAWFLNCIHSITEKYTLHTPDKLPIKCWPKNGELVKNELGVHMS